MISENKNEQWTVYVSDEVHSELVMMKVREHLSSMNDVIAKCLQEHLDNEVLQARINKDAIPADLASAPNARGVNPTQKPDASNAGGAAGTDGTADVSVCSGSEEE